MNREVLIVSPNFPPVNAPDMQRVRMSLPHFTEFGWQPRVLAVDPAYSERVLDPLLLETIPADTPIHRTRAFNVRWTRKLGVGDLGLRSLPFLYREGARLIKEHKPDLVYFSTTMFPVLILGRLWKQRFGVPFVVDMQDPWFDDYYDRRPASEHPPKYWLAKRMHGMLEPFAMKAVDGVIAVSTSYHETLRRRYPWITADRCRTISFGASEKDFQVAKQIDWRNPFFTPEDSLIHGACVGVLGRAKSTTCRALCLALRDALKSRPEVFSKVRFHFIGTDYSPQDRARETIKPIAIEYGLEQFIFEQTGRSPYLSALRLLQDADFLLVLGSDDPHYTASKIYPYILSRKPLLCVFHEQSSVAWVMELTRAGMIVSFGKNDGAHEIARKLLPRLIEFVQALPFTPPTDWKAFERFEARELTRKQCELFDQILPQRGPSVM